MSKDIGAFVLVLIVAAVLAGLTYLLGKGSVAGKQKNYDEEKKLIRLHGCKYALLTMIIYALSVVLVDSLFNKSITCLDGEMKLLLGAVLGVGVYGCYCIWLDGYYAFVDQAKSCIMGLSMLAVVCLYMGIMYWKNGRMLQAGVFTGKCAYLLTGLLFLALDVTLVLRKYWKRES